MKQSTEKQQAAVRYCEQWLYVEFDGESIALMIALYS